MCACVCVCGIKAFKYLGVLLTSSTDGGDGEAVLVRIFSKHDCSPLGEGAAEERGV